MTRAALCVAALAAFAGCGGERTEIVLFIDQAGLQIPRDIDTLHIRLARDSSAQPFFDVPIVICGGATTTCKSLPLTATLIPGDKMPDDNVRLQLDASLQGTPRISDVANFQFTRGQSLRLELVLTANCLDNLDCAKVDAACGEFGCYNPKPEPAGADLSVARDLAPPADLKGVDFAGVDFSCAPSCPAGYCGPDKNGCGVACTCGNFQACMANACAPCGLDDQACCPVGQTRCQSQNGPHACSSPTGAGTCVSCLGQGTGCSNANGATPCCQGTVCNGSMCVPCGMNAGDPCCPGSMCTSPNLTCGGNNQCSPCGANNQVCCNGGSLCDPGLTCVGTPPPVGGGSNHCTPCGGRTQPCCSGGCNLSSLVCDLNNNCVDCGQNTQLCCQFNVCNASFNDCDGTDHCALCGQNIGDSCCSNGTCDNGLQCVGGFMMSFWPNAGGGPGLGTCQAQSTDMASDMDGMDAGCGARGQLCCSTIPQCMGLALACNVGVCDCGYVGGPCCRDGTQLCQGGLFCNDGGGTIMPGMCQPAGGIDGGGGCAAENAPCCAAGPPFCTGGFTCCMAPSCSGGLGTVTGGHCFM